MSNHALKFILLILCLISITFTSSVLAKSNFLPEQQLKNRIQKYKKLSSHSTSFQHKLSSFSLVSTYYSKQAYALCWSNSYSIYDFTYDFIDYLSGLDKEGLDPSYYHLSAIRSLLHRNDGKRKKIRDLITLDVLLTDAYFYATDTLCKREI